PSAAVPLPKRWGQNPTSRKRERRFGRAFRRSRSRLVGIEECVLSIARWPDLLQFDRPVGVLQAGLPGLVLALGQFQHQHRRALRLLRLADQRQASLSRRAPALANVAGDAGADDVLPRRLAALAARRDVVQAQLTRRELLAAVLTLVVVPGEDVPAV